MTEPRLAVADYLRMVDGHMPEREGFKYRTYEGLVLAEGQSWTEARVERYGEWKMCFSNAAFASDANGWDYVEGYAWPEDMFPVLHAWCVDDDGLVVETTWDFTADEYYGVVIPMPVLRSSQLATGKHGLIPSDWERGAVLMTEGLAALP